MKLCEGVGGWRGGKREGWCGAVSRYEAVVLQRQASCGRKQRRWKAGVRAGERRFGCGEAEPLLSHLWFHAEL